MDKKLDNRIERIICFHAYHFSITSLQDTKNAVQQIKQVIREEIKKKRFFDYKREEAIIYWDNIDELLGEK